MPFTFPDLKFWMSVSRRFAFFVVTMQQVPLLNSLQKSRRVAKIAFSEDVHAGECLPDAR